jgi:hypothetical protein
LEFLHCFHGRDQCIWLFFYNTIRVTSSCIMIRNWFNRTSNVLFVYRNATNLSVVSNSAYGSCTVLLFSLHPVTSLKRSQFLLLQEHSCQWTKDDVNQICIANAQLNSKSSPVPIKLPDATMVLNFAIAVGSTNLVCK